MTVFASHIEAKFVDKFRPGQKSTSREKPRSYKKLEAVQRLAARLILSPAATGTEELPVLQTF